MEPTYHWLSNFKLNFVIYQYCGLWPRDYNLEDSSLPVLFFIVLTLSSSHLLTQIVELYFVRDRITLATEICYIILIESIGLMKMYILAKNVEKIKTIMKTFDLHQFQPKNQHQKKKIAACISIWLLAYRVILYNGLTINLLWMMIPLANDHQLSHLSWYPFDTTKSPGFEIAYVLQTLGLISLTILTVGFDGLVSMFNTFAACQFIILCDNIRNVHKLGDNFRENFLKCVDHHKQILKFINNFNGAVNWVLLAQFTTSAISIAIGMFQLKATAAFSFEFWALVCFFFATTGEIFTYCWSGNEVEAQSSLVPYAVFECKWTDLSKDLKKDLLFMTVKLQKPVRITSLNLFNLNLDTFMRIMKTAFSSFAVLKQVAEK